MDLKEIESHMKMLNELNLSHLEIEKNGIKISLKKHSNMIGSDTINNYSIKNDSNKILKNNDMSEKIAEKIIIKSKNVGIFFYVRRIKKGLKLKEGEAIAKVKSLGMDFEIISPISGTVVNVYKKNRDPVGYGDTILEISKD